MNDPRTLLLTLNAPGMPGGIARLYAELCRRFPRGHVEVLTVPHRDGVPWLQPVDCRVPIVHLPYRADRAHRFANVLRCVGRTSRLVKDRRIDVLQIGDLRPLGHVGAWIRTRQRVPYVLYVHGKDLCKEERKSHNSILKRAIGSEILGRAAAIIANSRFTAERARELMERVRIQHDDRVHVVHPGADPDRFRPDPVAARSVRRRLSIGGRSMILTVARLVPRKGVDMLLAALPAIAVRRRDVVLVVAGDGPDRARLESEARRLRLSERVAFLGTVGEDELPRLYAAADVFALPAREERAHDEVEGFGIVFCEAAASGLAVVAGDSGGVAEAVRDGETGVLVPPRDPRAIAEAVAGLLENDADRRSMGAAGRRAVRTYYNWDRAAEEAWRVITGAARCALRQTV